MNSSGSSSHFFRKPAFSVTLCSILEQLYRIQRPCVSLISSTTMCGISSSIEENKVQSSLQTHKYAENVIYYSLRSE